MIKWWKLYSLQQRCIATKFSYNEHSNPQLNLFWMFCTALEWGSGWMKIGFLQENWKITRGRNVNGRNTHTFRPFSESMPRILYQEVILRVFSLKRNKWNVIRAEWQMRNLNFYCIRIEDASRLSLRAFYTDSIPQRHTAQFALCWVVCVCAFTQISSSTIPPITFGNFSISSMPRERESQRETEMNGSNPV